MANLKKEERKIILKQDVIEVLVTCGVKKGDALFVHTSLSRLGYVCGGAQIIIEALIESVGEEGTIVMPSQSWKNLDPTAGVHHEEPEAWWSIIRENWPAYDKDITPTNTMGAVAEMFRRWPGARRSDHPARSVAAWGKHAEQMTRNHDLSNIFGDGSPLDRFYQINGLVLLIGVGYDKNTSLHLSDARASYPSKHYADESSAVFVDGQREWVTYNTLAVDGADFNEIGAAFEQEHRVIVAPLGNGVIRCMKQRDLVDFAVRWIEKNRA